MKLKNFFKKTVPLKGILDNLKLDKIQTRLVLEDFLGIDSNQYFLNSEDFVVPRAYEGKLAKIATQINSGMPIQYALKQAFFYKYKFRVDENVLIPRPESEEIISIASDFLSMRLKQKTNIVDVGTGSGCLAISLYKEFEHCPNFNFFALDASQKALSVAKINILEKRANIKISRSDLLSNSKLPQQFSLIIANLPYLDENKPIDELKFEPKSALYCANKGFALIERLIEELPARLEHDGLAILEVGHNHNELIGAMSKKFFQFKFTIQKDLNGFPRYLLIRFKRDIPLA